MILTCKNYNSVVWPIYGLHSRNIFYEDGLVISHNNRLIDDKTIPGDTLGRRRLKMMDLALYNFKTTNRSFIELIRNVDCPLYMDNVGRMVTYKKTVWARIEPAKIIKMADHGVWLEGASYPIMVAVLPPVGTVHCEALILDKYPIGIYSYMHSKKARRKLI